MSEGVFENGENQLQRKPALYIRRSEPINLATLLLLVGSCVALLTFVWRVTDGIQANFRQEVQNERHERINADQELRRDCCRRW